MSLYYFVLALIFTILFFVIIFSLKRIHLFLLKIFFSKYSYRYINVYKKYTNKNPHGYCIKDEFVFHILDFFSINTKHSSFTSNKAINFGDIEYFITYKELVKNRKKPFCFNSYFLNNKYDIKIIGYRDTIFNLSMRVIYYFIDDVFFMGEYVIKETSEIKIKRISKIIYEKYLDKSTITEVLDDNFYIFGINNTIMHFTNTGFALIIKYFSNQDFSTKAKIDEICNEYKGIVKNFEKAKFKDEIFEKL